MLKNITLCPECGESLTEWGLCEMRCYRHETDDGSAVIGGGVFEETLFKCGCCGHTFEYRNTEGSDKIQIIG